ncbi:MAG TPA: TIM-barrel domain-containing protein, partial [Kofleriaceae bacterium]|nr:TIM-barrel domain-containing protein [Kofleriaceae bacterium]
MLRPVLAACALVAAGCDAAVTTDSLSRPVDCECTGNAWHLPEADEPGLGPMRAPESVAAADRALFYTGNQFAGAGGNPGNQMQTGSGLLYRVGAGGWTEVPMTFHSQAGNNKYYRAAIEPGALRPGDRVEYYFRLAYSDHWTTFVHGAGAGSATSADEGAARAAPFSFLVAPDLSPAAGSMALAAGAGYQGRAHDSGHLVLAGPGVAGDLDVAVAPAAVRLAGRWALLADPEVAADGEAIELRYAAAGRAVTARVTAPREGVLRYEVIDWGGAPPDRLDVQLAAAPGEHFYGLGEKFDRLDQAGKVARILAVDAPGAKGDRSYKVAPWFVSSRGYGFRFDSPAESEFDLAAGHPDRVSVRVAHGRLAWELIGGPAPADALARYTAATGRPALPPAWAFAPWLSSDHWRTGGEVRYVVSRYRELGIPGSVFVFDSPWEVSYNDFRWNETQFAAGGTYDGASYEGFASSAEMMDFLRDSGFRVVLWLTPFLNVESNDEGVPGQQTGRSALYEEAAAAGYLVQGPDGEPLVVDWWKGRGSPIDFTDPAARAWYQDHLRRLVDESGGVVGGFKADDGESDFIPLTARYADGSTGAEMRNGFSIEYQRATWQVLGEEGVLLARSGFSGAQAFPGHWAGDNEPNFSRENGLAGVVVAGLSAAMSGYAVWGHDVGGYQTTGGVAAPEDLFTRWAQFGAVSPIMQIHRKVAGDRQYPWSYGEAALDAYRRAAALHVALFPTFYSYAAAAARTGLPILRPLPLAFPGDESVATVDDAFLVGEWLLAAPILEEAARARDVPLPAGTWYDFDSGEPV